MPKRMLAIAALLGASIACAAVDINLASEAELDGVKGFGPSTTARILTERQKARFKDWNDLMARIKGIKPASAAKLSANGRMAAHLAGGADLPAPFRAVRLPPSRHRPAPRYPWAPWRPT